MPLRTNGKRKHTFLLYCTIVLKYTCRRVPQCLLFVLSLNFKCLFTVHRIGRTGRHNCKGIATSFLNKVCDESVLLDLQQLLLEANQVVPEFLKVISSEFGGPIELEGSRFKSDDLVQQQYVYIYWLFSVISSQFFLHKDVFKIVMYMYMCTSDIYTYKIYMSYYFIYSCHLLFWAIEVPNYATNVCVKSIVINIVGC